MATEREKPYDKELAEIVWQVYKEGLEAGFNEAHNKTSKDAGQIKATALNALEAHLATNYTPKPAVPRGGELREKLDNFRLDDGSPLNDEEIGSLMQLFAAQAAAAQERAERELIIWAFQAEAKTEPKFATEPLAVAHRLVERMKELDPNFAMNMESTNG